MGKWLMGAKCFFSPSGQLTKWAKSAFRAFEASNLWKDQFKIFSTCIENFFQINTRMPLQGHRLAARIIIEPKTGVKNRCNFQSSWWRSMEPMFNLFTPVFYTGFESYLYIVNCMWKSKKIWIFHPLRSNLHKSAQ